MKKENLPATLQEIFEETKFKETICTGFRTCGLFPFDPNAPKYEKLVSSKKKSGIVNPDVVPTDSSPTTASSNPPELDALEKLEKKIPPEVLLQFLCQEGQYSWDQKYEGLYEVWKTMRQEAMGESPTCREEINREEFSQCFEHENETEALNLSVDMSASVDQFNGTESLNHVTKTTRTDHPCLLQGGDNAVTGLDLGLFMPEVGLRDEEITDDVLLFDFPELNVPSNSVVSTLAALPSVQDVSRSAVDVTTPFVPTFTVPAKAKSTNDILDEYNFFPEKTFTYPTSGRRKPTLHLPSVITHPKYIELKTALSEETVKRNCKKRNQEHLREELDEDVDDPPAKNDKSLPKATRKKKQSREEANNSSPTIADPLPTRAIPPRKRGRPRKKVC
jgi:hypothetical protein